MKGQNISIERQHPNKCSFDCLGSDPKEFSCNSEKGELLWTFEIIEFYCVLATNNKFMTKWYLSENHIFLYSKRSQECNINCNFKQNYGFLWIFEQKSKELFQALFFVPTYELTETNSDYLLLSACRLSLHIRWIKFSSNWEKGSNREWLHLTF